jgi:dCTP deaminase
MTNPKQGILPARAIARMCDSGEIRLARKADDDQIQPASLDLRLGPKAIRVRASFLPGRKLTVAEKLKELSLHEIDLTEGAVLETGCVYIVPLMESLKLSQGISAAANPKSSTGRLDIFTRVIADNAQAFDQVPDGERCPDPRTARERTADHIWRGQHRRRPRALRRSPRHREERPHRLPRQTPLRACRCR